MDPARRLAVVARRVERPDGDLRVSVVQRLRHQEKYALLPLPGHIAALHRAVEDDLDPGDADVVGPARMQPLVAADELTVHQARRGDNRCAGVDRWISGERRRRPHGQRNGQRCRRDETKLAHGARTPVIMIAGRTIRGSITTCRSQISGPHIAIGDRAFRRDDQATGVIARLVVLASKVDRDCQNPSFELRCRTSVRSFQMLVRSACVRHGSQTPV
jgi:hypothetical protein